VTFRSNVVVVFWAEVRFLPGYDCGFEDPLWNPRHTATAKQILDVVIVALGLW
jgi:hypothetical protein